jgi:hypothetical protein
MAGSIREAARSTKAVSAKWVYIPKKYFRVLESFTSKGGGQRLKRLFALRIVSAQWFHYGSDKLQSMFPAKPSIKRVTSKSPCERKH